jgi:hypothetical protein
VVKLLKMVERPRLSRQGETDEVRGSGVRVERELLMYMGAMLVVLSW